MADLFEKIDQIVQSNGNHYSKSMYEEAQRKMNLDERWSKCGVYMDTVSNQLMVAAVAVAAVNAPVAGAATACIRFFSVLAGAGVSKAIGRWMKPKTGDS